MKCYESPYRIDSESIHNLVLVAMVTVQSLWLAIFLNKCNSRHNVLYGQKLVLVFCRHRRRRFLNFSFQIWILTSNYLIGWLPVAMTTVWKSGFINPCGIFSTTTTPNMNQIRLNVFELQLHLFKNLANQRLCMVTKATRTKQCTDSESLRYGHSYGI